MSQFRLLGASLDYRRTRFTMDEGYYRAVMRWFVHLYERGCIYRANRIVNWCPRDQTALSDLEVEHEDDDDTLSYIRYPLADGSGHDHDRDGAAGDDPRRRRGRGPSRRRALPRARRQGGRRPLRRAARAGDRRRARRAGVRHRRAQDHARPRPDGLRDRPRPRPPGADRDRPRRTDERRRRGARRADAGGGRQARARVGRRARTAREARALPPLRRPLRALPQPHRAARHAAVVAGDGGARGACDRRGQGRASPLHARALRARLPRLDGEHPRLVHLAPDLVGPPDPGLVLPRRPRHRRRDRAWGVRRVRLGRAAAGGGRPRHVVLVGALSLRDARLAGRDAGARALLPRQRPRRPRGTSSSSGSRA